MFNIAVSTQQDSLGKSYMELASRRKEILGRDTQRLLGICQMERTNSQEKVL